jgi:hypothetical protein
MLNVVVCKVTASHSKVKEVGYKGGFNRLKVGCGSRSLRK